MSPEDNVQDEESASINDGDVSICREAYKEIDSNDLIKLITRSIHRFLQETNIEPNMIVLGRDEMRALRHRFKGDVDMILGLMVFRADYDGCCEVGLRRKVFP